MQVAKKAGHLQRSVHWVSISIRVSFSISIIVSISIRVSFSISIRVSISILVTISIRVSISISIRLSISIRVSISVLRQNVSDMLVADNFQRSVYWVSIGIRVSVSISIKLSINISISLSISINISISIKVSINISLNISISRIFRPPPTVWHYEHDFKFLVFDQNSFGVLFIHVVTCYICFCHWYQGC